MTLITATTARTQINANIETVFAQTVPIDLSIIFKRYSLIPAVLRTNPPAGKDWDTVGLKRQLFLADGNTAWEMLTKVDPPCCFSYKVFAVSNFIGKLAEYATGEWHFKAHGSSTSVEWTYSFMAKNAVARLPLLFIVRTFFHGYMKQALRLLKDHIEQGYEHVAP